MENGKEKKTMTDDIGKIAEEVKKNKTETEAKLKTNLEAQGKASTEQSGKLD